MFRGLELGNAQISGVPGLVAVFVEISLLTCGARNQVIQLEPVKLGIPKQGDLFPVGCDFRPPDWGAFHGQCDQGGALGA